MLFTYAVPSVRSILQTDTVALHVLRAHMTPRNKRSNGNGLL